ncbi:O-antigen ligase family protein [candidate division KSB1 bacterium]|nr:O-antigen ligase family protein [candidate division KSB1 bacterium]
MVHYLKQSLVFAEQRQFQAGLLLSLIVSALGLLSFFEGRVAFMLAAMAAIPVLLLLLKYPIWGLYVSAFNMTSAMDVFVPHLATLSVLLPMFAVCLRKIINGDFTWRLPPIWMSMLLLFSWMYIALIWLPPSGTVYGFAIQYGVGVLNVLLIWELVRTPKQFRTLILILSVGIVVTAVSSVIEIVNFLTTGLNPADSESVARLKTLRLQGHWGHANSLAHGLMPFVPLLIPLVDRFERRSLRLYASFAILCGIVAIGLSLSRAGILALFFALIVTATASRYRRLLIVLTLMTGTLLLFLLPTSAIERFAAIGGKRHDASLNERQSLYQSAYLSGEDRFPFGGGVGDFDKHYQDYTTTISVVHHAHNLYLHFFNDHGLPGLILLAFFVYCLLRSASRGDSPERPGSFEHVTRVALLSSLIGIFTIGYMFDNLFYLMQHWVFFGIVSVFPYAVRADDSQRELQPTI